MKMPFDHDKVQRSQIGIPGERSFQTSALPAEDVPKSQGRSQTECEYSVLLRFNIQSS